MASLDLFFSLLPFLFLLGFWAVATRQYRSKGSPQQQMIDKLEQIRSELERLRKSIDERDSGGFGFRS